ncbi:MAG: enoyl-CoA hydratase-related protein [Rhodospirillales bacterium]|nr:enoyl-CoA hydratase-related protein [Rhodospirillales bacterium]
MAFDTIDLQRDGAVAVLTLDRPKSMNPLDWATVKELTQALAQLEKDETSRVVIITGRGQAFSAGGDLKAYMELYRRPDEFRSFLDDFRALNAAIEASAIMVIAAINGFCVAGGLELMLACDIALAAREARIGDGHLNFGQLPGAGGSQRLIRAIGPAHARELIYSGRLMGGAEAREMGLVARAVPAEQLMETARDLAGQMLEKSPLGLAQAKTLLARGRDMDLTAAINMELELVHRYATTSHDAVEGLAAFAEKRKPDFKGN